MQTSYEKIVASLRNPSGLPVGTKMGTAPAPSFKGTSLICLATEDGVFLAADDLVYIEEDGKAIPARRDFHKVGATENVLIGTAGLMIHTDIKYDVTDWTANLMARLKAASIELPSAVAENIHQALQETFKPAEPLVARDVWKGYVPGDRLVNYVVAGYTKNFKRPYIFEIGVEINATKDGLAYISPIPHQKALPNDIRFGEDHFMERADEGFEPEQSVLVSLVDTVFPDVARAFPDIPPAFQEAVACTVGCIQVEAHFIPEKVGSRVHVVLIDRKSRSIHSSAFGENQNLSAPAPTPPNE